MFAYISLSKYTHIIMLGFLLSFTNNFYILLQSGNVCIYNPADTLILLIHYSKCNCIEYFYLPHNIHNTITTFSD